MTRSTATTPFTLRLRGLIVGYGREQIAGPIDADWPSGRIHVIVGPNGSGKSTLLRTVLGHLPPLSGAIDGLDDRRIGAVPQIGTLDDGFPVTVREVVETGLPREAAALRRARIAAALEAVGMAEQTRQRFFHMSGGQRQRVLIARALATDPEVLVLDEPTAGVDADAARQTWMLLRALAQREGKLVLVVTHDLFLSAEHADQTHRMGDGQLEEETA